MFSLKSIPVNLFIKVDFAPVPLSPINTILYLSFSLDSLLSLVSLPSFLEIIFSFLILYLNRLSIIKHLFLKLIYYINYIYKIFLFPIFA